MSVERDINGKKVAVTWWVDDVMMDEAAGSRRRPSDRMGSASPSRSR